MKIGNKAVMIFKMGGIASEEECTIIAVNGDNIQLDTDEDPDKCKIFCTKTGKCLNDDTTFGASRSLKL